MIIKRLPKLKVIGLCLGLFGVNSAIAQDDPFAEYRAMMGDDNPAIFVSEEGADLWQAPNGPKQASFEQCDLGLGPGIVEGAYAQLPRYFADTQQVMDLESRLFYCMETLQGRSPEEARKKPYSSTGDMGTEIEALVTYIAEQSTGMPIALPQQHPLEIAAYEQGKSLFYYRAGPHDFSCATCHRQSDKRIRLQNLPNLTTNEGAGAAYSSWPAYRISQGLVRTMGWRMQSCGRQQRLPELQPGSEAVISLMTFMGVNAKGTEMAAPGLKR
ncbi:sulfur oxidation c-type cytochrome SoxA [Spongiibacter sp. KMU-158]|uniref:SoxAX cytochrome complex subunit A n=1 Tax=Spongiibacter pelagi TaxID=2760804 RepID=A0A927C626_9GAMM|nr:sulfur oxidation c-type cytochrome SoxA [Spongiibacter pelagi]MBD2860231.1 sulfur oxidation c-type cytochrome SoxA [Spongiibacter pelagi]